MSAVSFVVGSAPPAGIPWAAAHNRQTKSPVRGLKNQKSEKRLTNRKSLEEVYRRPSLRKVGGKDGMR
jgi:hypothetical protein